jgi:hypothetical protein
MKEKHFEIESAQLANEKKAAQAGDYSIKRCISEMMKMALSTDEKAAAAADVPLALFMTTSFFNF